MSETSTARTARSRDAILRAAIDLCVDQGYSAVTIEAIAARARVGKPTVYRWWRSKNAVLLDALLEMWAAPIVPLPESDDVAGDLRTWLHRLADTFNDPRLRAVITGVIGAAQHDPQLKNAIRERIHTPLRSGNQSRIVAAQRAGLLPEIDPELLEDSLVAPLWYRMLVSGAPLDHEYADAILANVLRN
ncbi:TetR/AcrR family transcriptional regulator [Saccharopolyspora sp. NPDC050389]|uniref:TetR/AcrR family transcriptional regulator n=1 Tax=Saccharopolyspora sp. NPDC050389 TaxID=3155516 RepID=UPI0033FCCF88